MDMLESAGFFTPVVVHYTNGTIVKCHATGTEMGPTHVLVNSNDGTSYKIRNRDLKAVFFVKTLIGDDEYNESRKFPEGFHTTGQKIGVRFKDGERIVGVSHDFDPKKPGFNLVPADGKSNNLKIYVLRSSLHDLVLLH
ncbi:MAG: hypothetical protein U0166_19195 [Acidobacteriota bacterium]